MTRRYFVPELPPSGGLVALGDDEARHAARVMRAHVGDAVILFDGAGNQADATIHAIDKRTCVVDSHVPRPVDREPSCRIRFGIAFPKPERAKEMIERLTELGVHRITPITCERTQRPPTQSLLMKLRRIVIESSKQCERNLLMKIDDPESIEAMIAEPPQGVRLMAHPTGRLIQSIDREIFAKQPANERCATVLVGPEGGFTDREVETAETAGFEPVGLGKRIYRIETAACAIAARLTD